MKAIGWHVTGWTLIVMAVILHFCVCEWHPDKWLSGYLSHSDHQIMAFICARHSFSDSNPAIVAVLGVIGPIGTAGGGIAVLVYAKKKEEEEKKARNRRTTSPSTRPPEVEVVPKQPEVLPPVVPEIVPEQPSPNLYPCPDCGRQVSRLATTCPQCGRPLQPQEKRPDSAPPIEPLDLS